MRGKIRIVLPGLLTVLWAAGSMAAPEAPADQAAAKLRAAGAELRVTPRGDSQFVRAPFGGALPLSSSPTSSTPEGIGREALREYGPAFGLADPSQVRFNRSFVRNGRSTARFQQLHQGLPVIGGELVVNTRGQQVTSINGKTARRLKLATSPELDAAEARARAVEAVAKWYKADAGSLKATEPELSVYVPSLIGPGKDSAGELVWRVEVREPGRAVNEFVLVDARNGAINLHFSQVDKGGLNRFTYTASGTGTVTGKVCDENAPDCGGDADAQAAFDYAGDTYTFYAVHHGRDSVDDAGLPLVSIVDFNDGVTCPNAFWDGEKMVYCDGFPQADDVVAHELTHGVTDYTSQLFYYFESGAINESLSDIWGEFVDLTNGAGTDTPEVRWLIGEDAPGGAIRSMSDPNAYEQPDRVGDTTWYYKAPVGVLEDNGGVHTNSGVNNKAAFLMVDGGTFNGETVTGIGIKKVADIYYRVQTAYLTSGSTFNDLYFALQYACADLQADGVSGITAGDCTQVTAAAQAVEMDVYYPAYTPKAGWCPAGETPVALLSDDLEDGAGNFDLSGDFVLGTGYAASGTKMLYGKADVLNSDSAAALKNAITLPRSARLWFTHAYEFESGFDGGILEYSTDNGTTWSQAPAEVIEAGATYNGTISLDYGSPLAGQNAFTDMSHGYVSTRVNLSPLAGLRVKLRWRFATDAEVASFIWAIDDVMVYGCAPAAPTGLDGVGGGGNASLTWTDNSSDEEGFKVYRSTDGVTFKAVAELGADSIAWTDTGLTGGVTYSYYVVSHSGVESAHSNTISIPIAADGTKPTVTAVTPANAATGVQVNKVVSATFSEAMNCATLTTTSFTLKDPAGTKVAGAVKCSGNAATFTSTAVLAAGKKYTATISTAAKDAGGNALAAAKSWYFTTISSGAKDTAKPTVTAVTPANGATAIALRPTLTATFSEAMDCATVNTTTFTLTGGGAAVAGKVTCSNKTATFVPGALLSGGTVYTAKVTTGAKDLARNALSATKTWSFTTDLASLQQAGVKSADGGSATDSGGGALEWFGLLLLGLPLLRRRAR